MSGMKTEIHSDRKRKRKRSKKERENREQILTLSLLSDNIVNQLLSKIDGVNQLRNVLIIGMTNRIELIDPALLRAKRIGIHIEIGLPDKEGRQQILQIHTAAMREHKLLAEEVDLVELAERTKNYSGAELSKSEREKRVREREGRRA